MYIVEIKRRTQCIQVGDTIITYDGKNPHNPKEARLIFRAPRHIQIDREEIHNAKKTGRKRKRKNSKCGSSS